MFFFDPLYILFSLPAILVMLWAQAKVQGAYGKYSQVRNLRGLTGADVAKRLLEAGGLYGVRLEETPGQLSDHYDPRSKVLRLSPGVARIPSVAAMGIVAHEVGHALQDAMGYAPLKLRGALVVPVNLGSSLGPILFLLGLFAQSPNLVWLGIILFSGAVLFTIITLPVELDASRRALAMLSTTGLVTVQEMDGAKAVLSAAAWTYVAAALQAVSSLLYYVFYALGMSNREE